MFNYIIDILMRFLIQFKVCRKLFGYSEPINDSYISDISDATFVTVNNLRQAFALQSLLEREREV